jgi:hypothetical protein
VIIVAITMLLAGVDLVGAVMAKEWAASHEPWLLLVGVVASLALFSLFAIASRYAEMSTVTLGWIVMLQVGLMVTERVRYSVDHGADRWLAVVAMVALQGYLMATATPS